MAVAPSNPQIIYVLKGNLISKSTNGGTSFSNITGTLPTNLAFPTNLAVSNTDDKKVWVTFSGYAANEKVYKSIDGGTSWINVSAGLPNIPMNTIAYTNNSPTDAVYLGADKGILYGQRNALGTLFYGAPQQPRQRLGNLLPYLKNQGRYLRSGLVGK